MLFATCSFPEFNPAGGGIPVRSSNGFPRYKLKYPLVHKMPSTFPNWDWMKLPQAEFYERYIEMIAVNEAKIIEEALAIRELEAEQIRASADEVPIVLLCFEQLAKKPGSWCHRHAFAAAWRELSGQTVPELGAMPAPETRAAEAQQEGLF